jgi:dTDP-4-dehydrorhamnose 3,5-epimerase-like enzyme
MSLPTCEFTVEKTEILGLLIIKVNAIGDDRGWY